MEKDLFTDKPVAVLNKSIEPGKLMNALAHMCIGLGGIIHANHLKLCEYVDANNSIHPYISAMPFIILQGNSSQIRKLRAQAIEHEILYNDFTDTMTIGTYQEQMAKTKLTEEEDLTYYGIVLFGDWNKVTELTRKFSLWR